VVVAAGAPDREPQNGPAERLDRILDHEVRPALGVDPVPPGDRQVARRDDTLIPLLLARGGEDVPRDLLLQEPVVGLVAVERVDHVVAV
jgi:hypothetical protein